MMRPGQNDDTDDLQRKRRSLKGKIDRRWVTIGFLKSEAQTMTIQLALIEQQLRDRGVKVRK